MFYRKHFQGENSENTNKAYITFKDGYVDSCYETQTDTLCNCIIETLQGAGIDCGYDLVTKKITIDGFSFNIYYNTNYSYVIRVYSSTHKPIPDVTSSNLTSYQPFNTDYKTYDFYVTLKGDIDGVMNLYIGTNSNPAREEYGFSLAKGTCIVRGGEPVRMFSVNIPRSGNTFFNVYEYNGDAFKFPNGDSSELQESLLRYSGTSYALANNSGLNVNGTKIPLIPSITYNGCFMFNNTYMTINNWMNYSSGGKFYKINGDIYYIANHCQIVKCK